MGVHGLWKLIDAAGKPVPVETLENKVLAVDVSIWLHQLVKGFQDVSGGGANPHLLGLFYRICKLLFFRVKPVFVFDGGVPALKKRTIAARQSGRSKASESADRHRLELLQNLLKQHAVGLLLGKDVPLPRVTSAAASKTDRLFQLPPAPSTSKESDEEGAVPKEEEFTSSDDDYEPKASRKYGDIHSIDVASQEFKSLPADMRHDILSELKETRKQNSWAKLHLMPDESNDFSNFQMQRLLKRRSVQVGLEQAEKEMGPRGFTINEIQEMLKFHGVDISQRIASDSSTRFIYSALKSLPKKPDVKEEGAPDELVELTKIGEAEEEGSDIDDPLFEAMANQKDLTQEEILAIIKEQAEKNLKNETDDDKESANKEKEESENTKESKQDKNLEVEDTRPEVGVVGGSSKNVNEPVDQITDSGGDNGCQPWKPEPGKVSLVKRKKHFDDKAVTKLLREATKKNLPPISKFTLEPKRKKGQKKRKAVRNVLTGPNLSESSSSEDSGDEKKVVPSKRPAQLSKRPIKIDPIPRKFALPESVAPKSNESRKMVEQELLDEDDDLFMNVEIPDIPASSSQSKESKAGNVYENPKKTTPEKGKSIEIILDLNQPLQDEDDIFKDIFDSPKEPKPISNSSSSDGDFEEVKDEDSSPEVLKRNLPVKNDSPERLINSPEDSDSSDSEVNRFHTRLQNEPEPTFLDDKDTDDVTPKIDASRVANTSALLEELMQQASKLRKEVGSEVKMISPEKTESTKLLQYNKDDLEDDAPEESPSVPSSQELPGEADKSVTDTGLEGSQYFGGDQSALSPVKKSQSDLSKELLTVDQVRQFQSTLEKESRGLIREQRREERVAATVNEQITLEAQELLRLFGIPWVVAPMEAEAQCAYLDLLGLTQGTITDDSDIWLFGANNVYKNFFDQKKFVKLFKSTDIKKVYNMGRDELIMVGLLVGSDYTVGLSGVGPVTALEIIASYPPGPDDLVSPCDRLARFAAHMKLNKLSKRLAKKLLPVHLTEGFPSAEVVRAYTSPVVDESSEKFSWSNPDIDKIRDYAMEKFGWSADKTTKTLEPVFDKLKQDKTQTTLHGFFSWAFDDVQSKMSKRVESAVNLLGNPMFMDDEDADDPEQVQQGKRKTQQPPRKKKAKHEEGSDSASVPDTAPWSPEPGPSSREPVPGPSTAPDGSPEPEEPPTQQPGAVKRHTLLRRVNQTIEMIKKGKKLVPPGRQARKTPKESFLMKPHPLDMEGPFEVGEMPKRRKVARTDEEKVREIEEARAKAARVREKLKMQHIKEDEF